MNEKRADMRADVLLIKILESQPNLLGPMPAHTENGSHVGDFIIALHEKLAEHFVSRKD